MRLFACIISIVFVSVVSKAQSIYPVKAKFSIGLDGGLPVGSSNNRYNIMTGIFVQESVPIVKAIHITANLTYNKIKGRNNIEERNPNAITYKYPDIDMIAAKAGIKYYISPGLYLRGEAGAAVLESTIGFVYAPQIGYEFPINLAHNIDAAFRYEGSNHYGSEGYGSISLVSVRAAYVF